MYIYADVVLLFNVIMNSIVLWLTAHAVGIGFSWKRLLLAALSGGFYALAGILPAIAMLYSIPGKLIVSVVLIFIAFGRRSIKTTLLLVGTFYIVSFVLGGAAVGWLFFIQNEAPYRAGNILESSWQGVAISSVVAIALIVLLVRRLIHNKISRRRTFYQTEIEYKSRCEQFKGMLDTGNTLYSLLGRKPVVLLAWQAALPLVGPQVADYLTQNIPEVWLSNLDACQDTAWLARVEVIPCQSVGGKNMVLGFRPDSITLFAEDGPRRTTEVLIGLYGDVFACGSDYQALLHPALITGVNSIKEAGICALPGQ